MFELMSVHVAVPDPGLNVTSNTWPGWPGVYAWYPLKETNAWFGFAGSIAMLLTNRSGVEGVSIRRYVTACGRPLTFLETNTRPTRVPAHRVPSSPGARSVATT